MTIQDDTRGWGYSLDGESFHGPFDTRDAAIADARDTLKHEDRARDVELCRCDSVDFADSLAAAFRADNLLDAADEDACETHGCADTVFEQNAEARADLEEMLADAGKAWLAKYPCRSWFDAADRETITLEPMPNRAPEGR